MYFLFVAILFSFRERNLKPAGYCMVRILDVSSEHIAHVYNKIAFLPRKKIGFDDSFDVTKFLQQI